MTGWSEGAAERQYLPRETVTCTRRVRRVRYSGAASESTRRFKTGRRSKNVRYTRASDEMIDERDDETDTNEGDDVRNLRDDKKESEKRNLVDR